MRSLERLQCVRFCSKNFGGTFQLSFFFAVTNAILAGVLQRMFPDGSLSLFGEDGGILKETIVWSGFTFLLGFLVVFRSSQSYARWWEGCTAAHKMRSEWVDAVNGLNSFISNCGADPFKVRSFKNLLVRLVSLLHATALANLETAGAPSSDDLAYDYDLISAEGIDVDSLLLVSESECKVEMICGWLQHLIMANVHDGTLTTPPPLLTRLFQQIADRVIEYHSAMRLATTPFPAAYSQTCDGLLIMHWFVAPLVTSQWATHAVWAALFTFIQVFVLHILNRIAGDLANPFGSDANDVDGHALQEDMNKFLLLLCLPAAQRPPRLVSDEDGDLFVSAQGSATKRRKSTLNNIRGMLSRAIAPLSGTVTVGGFPFPAQSPTHRPSYHSTESNTGVREALANAVETNFRQNSKTSCDSQLSPATNPGRSPKSARRGLWSQPTPADGDPGYPPPSMKPGARGTSTRPRPAPLTKERAVLSSDHSNEYNSSSMPPTISQERLFPWRGDDGQGEPSGPPPAEDERSSSRSSAGAEPSSVAMPPPVSEEPPMQPPSSDVRKLPMRGAGVAQPAAWQQAAGGAPGGEEEAGDAAGPRPLARIVTIGGRADKKPSLPSL
mmetsp:Transcript_122787/g.352646  ORF Transcript_122787/g.352646 Transcript_122787/m.352646 type:complete len:611 (-) Transcript_122787:19-1851(-)